MKKIIFTACLAVSTVFGANEYESNPIFGKISFSQEEMSSLRRQHGYFSQVGEDIILSTVFKQEIEEKKGRYIDVGAHHPKTINVCHYFYLNGWRGINIEPQPKFHEMLMQERQEDKNLQCLIGKEKGELILHEVLVENAEWVSALSTASEKTSKILTEQRGYKTKEYLCPMITMDDVITEHLTDSSIINFLKIDVEGFERDVLEGMNLKKTRPLVIVIEILSPAGPYGYKEWGDILLSNNYKLVFADRLNFYYVRAESKNIIERFSHIKEDINSQFK